MNIRHILWLAPILFLTLGYERALAAPTPTEQIKATVDAVIATVTDQSLDPTNRRQKTKAEIVARFNFPGMSQRILARNWKSATAEQRKRFIALFTDLLGNTYLNRIEEYTDEKVEYVGEKIRKHKYAQVDTQVVTDRIKIPIGYKLQLKGDEWFVYDVIIEGVSLVRSYRTSYQDLAKKQGIDAVLTKMEERVNQQPSGN